jgi:hypothetical protein
VMQEAPAFRAGVAHQVSDYGW